MEPSYAEIASKPFDEDEKLREIDSYLVIKGIAKTCRGKCEKEED